MARRETRLPRDIEGLRRALALSSHLVGFSLEEGEDEGCGTNTGSSPGSCPWLKPAARHVLKDDLEDIPRPWVCSQGVGLCR